MADIVFEIAPIARHAEGAAELLEKTFQEPVDPLLDALRAGALLDLELVALSKGAVVGYAAAAVATAEREPARLLGEIYLLAVDVEHQGLGAGRKLVWALMDRLRKRGHLGLFAAGLHGYMAHFGLHPVAARGLTSAADPLLGLELVAGGLDGLKGSIVLQPNPWRK